MAVYYATKAFVLSFSEATADELRDTGVKVSVLCPGPTISGFQATARMQRSRLMQRAMMDTMTVAEAGYRGLMAGTRVIVPGMQNKTVPLMTRLLPRKLVTILSRRAAEVA
jgi:short-subunit dehydrogenase